MREEGGGEVPCARGTRRPEAPRTQQRVRVHTAGGVRGPRERNVALRAAALGLRQAWLGMRVPKGSRRSNARAGRAFGAAQGERLISCGSFSAVADAPLGWISRLSPPPGSFLGFSYPLALTAWHQIFCSAVAWGAAYFKVGGVETVQITRQDFIRRIMPIGVLFAGVLWTGNAAYLYLSVSFIQMVKAFMPVLVYFTGLGFGLERFRLNKLGILILIVTGVAIASFGEIHFVWFGFMLLIASLVLEAVRVCSLQVLLQRAGLKLNPMQTLMYIAPVTAGFLTPAAVLLESASIMHNTTIVYGPSFYLTMVTNASCALALNIVVFKVIKGQSALTLNVAGVVKDWLLIGLSYALYHSPVTAIQLWGYGLAFLGVGWYNQQKRADAAAKPPPASTAAEAKTTGAGGSGGK